MITQYMAYAKPNPRVAMFLSPSQGYTRGILRGALRYAAARASWNFKSEGVADPGPLRDPLNADGVVGFLAGEMLERCRRERRLAVNVSDAADAFDIPRVVVDSRAVGRLAAKHLMEKGCAAFAFVGRVTERVGGLRLEGCQTFLHEHGFEVHVTPEASRPRGEPIGAPVSWLRSLPRPCGVFCFSDVTAARVVASAQAAALDVPNEIAVVGVDNDDLVCRTVRPDLSSVEISLETIGFEAAALLDSMLQGGDIPAEPITLAPSGVVERGSSRVTAVADPLVSRARAFIRQQLDGACKVTDIVRYVGISRRSLEYRFQSAAGRSPHAEIRLARCERACDLLENTDRTLASIAEHCGFSSPSHFSKVFMETQGMRPGEYRRRLLRHRDATG